MDFDTQLPEYCPDIARLVKVDCTPFCESCTIQDGKAVITGKAVYDLLYETDYKSRLRCCSYTQDFTHSVPIPHNDATALSAFCDLKCQRIGCKLLGPRRMIIKSSLSAHLDIEGESAVKTIAVKDDGEAFFRKKTIGFDGRTAEHEETYKYSESFPLLQTEKNIGEIVSGAITLQPPQITLYPSKAEIKTAASVHVLCEEEDNEGKYYMSVKNLPLNIEYSDDVIEDFKHVSASLSVCDPEFILEPDQYGENRVIKTVFAVKMKLFTNEPKAYTVADDVFEKGYDGVPVKSSAVMPSRYSKTEANFSTEAKLGEMSPQPESIIDATVRDFGSAVEKTDGGVNVSGNFIITVMANTTDGIYSFDHSIPYSQFIAVELPENESAITADTYPIEVLTTLHPDGSASARVIAGTSVYVFTETAETFISEVTKRTPAAKQDDGSTLVYYFPQKGEDLWDIAKNYRTNPKTISDANPDVFEENGTNSKPDNPILIKI